MVNLVIFAVLLINILQVNVDETFTDVFKYYVLQITANKFSKCIL